MTAFSGMYVRDGVAEVLKVFALATTAMVFVYAAAYLQDRGLLIGEFYMLILFAVLGTMVLVSAGSLVTVYLGLELLTLSSYALVAMNRDSALSSEAAMKYFVLGALASGSLLYGMSMVYGASGMGGTQILDLAQLHHAMRTPVAKAADVRPDLHDRRHRLQARRRAVPHVDTRCLRGRADAGDHVHRAGSKLAAFGMAYRLLDTGMGDLAQHWQLILAVLAIASLAIGNLVAIVQTNLKRMLAYSTISHMGYVLLGLSAANPEGYAAAMFYVICYALMGTAAFGIMLALARAGFECEEIDDLKGLNQKAPWMAFLMLLAMFSLAGVPPLFGFWAKVLVLEAAIDAGMLWLAIVGIVCGDRRPVLLPARDQGDVLRPGRRRQRAGGQAGSPVARGAVVEWPVLAGAGRVLGTVAGLVPARIWRVRHGVPVSGPGVRSGCELLRIEPLAR